MSFAEHIILHDKVPELLPTCVIFAVTLFLAKVVLAELLDALGVHSSRWSAGTQQLLFSPSPLIRRRSYRLPFTFSLLIVRMGLLSIN